MANYKIEPIAGPFTLAEGPHWDVATQSLYFVDIDENLICKYSPVTKQISKIKLDKPAGFVIPVEHKANQFVVGYGPDFALVEWDGVKSEPDSVRTICKGDPNVDGRINDGKCDPTGRVWAGSLCAVLKDGQLQLRDECCSLFSIDHGSVSTRLSKVTVSNGLAWSLDQQIMYYIDSVKDNVRAFDFDAVTGNIDNERVVFELKSLGYPGFPSSTLDGMTIDAEGKLWISVFGFGEIIRVDPVTSQLLFRIPLPAHQTTSVIFGGKNLDELYVTSGNYVDFLPEGKGAQHTHGGHVFRITGVGVRGLPGNNAKL